MPGVEAGHAEEALVRSGESGGNVLGRVDGAEGDRKTGVVGYVDVLGPHMATGDPDSEDVAHHQEAVGADQHAAEAEHTGLRESLHHPARGAGSRCRASCHQHVDKLSTPTGVGPALHAGPADALDPSEQLRGLRAQVGLLPTAGDSPLKVPVGVSLDLFRHERAGRREAHRDRFGLRLQHLVEELGVECVDRFGQALEGHSASRVIRYGTWSSV